MHSLITPLLVTMFGLISMIGVPSFAAPNPDNPEAESAQTSQLDEARATLESGNDLNAMAQLVRYLGDDPGNVEAWVMLARAYQSLGQTEEAEAALDRALELAPDHPGALLTRGELYLATGRLEAARVVLARLSDVCGGPFAEAETLGRAIDARVVQA